MEESFVKLSALVDQMVEAVGVERLGLLGEVRVAEFVAGILHTATWFRGPSGVVWRYAGGRLPRGMLAGLTAWASPGQRPCGLFIDPIEEWEPTRSGWIGRSPFLASAVEWPYFELPAVEFREDVWDWLFDTLREEEFRNVLMGEDGGSPHRLHHRVDRVKAEAFVGRLRARAAAGG